MMFDTSMTLKTSPRAKESVKTGIQISVLVLLGIFLFFNVVLGATIFTDDFNSYNNGNLNGQGNWSGSSIYQIQGNLVKEGLKAVKIESEVGGNIIKTGNSLTNGSIVVYVRKADLNSETWFEIFSTNNEPPAIVDFSPNGWIICIGGGNLNLKQYNLNQWYGVKIEWRSEDHKIRCSSEDNIFTAWQVPMYGWSAVNKLQLGLSGHSGNSISYYDYVDEDFLAPPPEEEEGKIFVFPNTFVASSTAYIGDLASSVGGPLVLVFGVLLGMWLLDYIIGLIVDRRKDDV